MGARLLLTAGFDRAQHVIALAEMATRAGHDVAAVLVVNPFRIARLRAFLRQRGARAVLDAARRLAGLRRSGDLAPDPMETYCAEQAISARSLRAWCRRHRTRYVVVSDLNASGAIECLTATRADGVLYGGGGILRKAFLGAAGGRVLNAHSGPLPEIRGMNACEWSIVLGYPPCVTIHVIDRGIDTGGVIERIPLPLSAGDDIARLRSLCAVLGVEGLLRAIPRLADGLPASIESAATQRQCFVMAPALLQLAERRLASRLRSLADGAP